MPSLTYNRENNIIIKNDIILNIKNTIFYLRNTDVIICIHISSSIIEGLNHYLDIIKYTDLTTCILESFIS
jgi:hypothetical protein